MLIVAMRYTIKPGERAEFMKTVQEEGIIAASKKEDGNLGYDCYYPFDSDEDVYWIEKWRNKEAWDAHKTTSHSRKFQGIKENYVMSMIPELFETK